MSAIANGPWSRRGAVETSAEAAESMIPELGALQLEVLRAIRSRPGTADETATLLRRSPLSVRPRTSELRDAGLITDTGLRRPNASGKSAAVWSVTAVGIDVLETHEPPVRARDAEEARLFANFGVTL